MPDRHPRSVFGVGKDPDPRFSFANERTFLAWIRTALAFLAFAVAVDYLGSEWPTAVRRGGAVATAAVAAVTSILAARHWRRAERAMRLGQPLPAPRILLICASAVALAALVGVAMSWT